MRTTGVWKAVCVQSKNQCVFSLLQGMDASDEPLLQFKFRVQFYVETHLLLRYVFLPFTCMPSLPVCRFNYPPHHLSPLSSPRVLHSLFPSSFVPTSLSSPPTLIVLASRSCTRSFSTSPQAPSVPSLIFNAPQPPAVCVFVISLSFVFFTCFFPATLVPSVLSVLTFRLSPPQGRPLPPPLLPAAARERVALSAATQRGGRLPAGLTRSSGRPRGLQRGPAPWPLL